MKIKKNEEKGKKKGMSLIFNESALKNARILYNYFKLHAVKYNIL